MNLLDLLIVVAAAGALGNGFRRGFSLSSLSYGGLVAGTAVGAFLTPLVGDALGVPRAYGPLVGLAMLFLAASVGSSVGYALGEPLRLRVLRSRPGRRLDSVAGAAFSVVTVLATAWFLGLSFARGPLPAVSREITTSAILRAIDDQFPRPPGFLAEVERIVAAVPYPQVFDRLQNPDLGGPVQVDPAVASNAAVRRVATEVVKVRSLGCGGEVFGSGYPVGPNYIISNAHVVAGTHDHVVRTADGRNLQATVVLFDPERDVSIMYIPSLNLPVPPLAAAERGTTGATIGYPGGGNEVVGGAAVRAEVSAFGRDIYGDREVQREIYVLAADIHPGNSGGPMVDETGHVLGVVFANSTTDPSEGYALTNTEVAQDVRAGVGLIDAASTGSRCSD
ncbi:MAG: MarP family serine protease [Candidatus Dormibacteria bacterium]